MNNKFEGSAGFDAALAEGQIIGTPTYASYAPHHQRGAGGAWEYVNLYLPEEEVALRWLAQGNPIIVHGLWVVTDGDGSDSRDPAWIRSERGATIEDMLEIRVGQLIDAGEFDVPAEDEDASNEWLNMSVLGIAGDTPEDYPVHLMVGCWVSFKTIADRDDFLAEVRELREQSERENEAG